MALMNYNRNDFPPEEIPEYTPTEPAPKSRFRRFFTVLAILALIFLSAAVILFFYGSRLIANQQNMAVRMNAEHTATIMAAVNSTLAAIDQPVLPTASLAPSLENTATESSTNTPMVNTNTPVPTFTWTPELTETAIVAALQTEIATQMPLLAGTLEVTPTVQDTVATESTPVATEQESTPVATEQESTPVVMTPTLQPEFTATLEAPTLEPTAEIPAVEVSTETMAPTPTLLSTETAAPTATPIPTETAFEPKTTEPPASQAEELTPTATAEITALPDTGFADDYGLPFFGLAALGLILVVLIVRLLRFVFR